MLRKDTKEKKLLFMVLSGFVDLPDNDGVVKDVQPWEKHASGKDKGKVKRVDNELVWTPVTREYFPSQVGHIVKAGKLCLVSELEEFYPEHYAIYLDSLNAKEKAALDQKAKDEKTAKDAK